MKYYKVYEFWNNEYSEDTECANGVCVGIYKNEQNANELCEVIDIMHCNATEIIYDFVTKQDFEDIQKFMLKGTDCFPDLSEVRKEICSSQSKSTQEGFEK